MRDLVAFCREAAAEPFAFGQWDCAMTLANWIERRTGNDPAADLRGAYASELGWLRIVAGEGSLAGLVGRLALAAGLKPVPDGELVAGDVGVIPVKLAGGQAGAIYAGEGRWVMKLRDGLIGVTASPVAAWGLR